MTSDLCECMHLHRVEWEFVKGIALMGTDSVRQWKDRSLGECWPYCTKRESGYAVPELMRHTVLA